MKQSAIISIVIALLVLWLPANLAFGQPAAAIPTVRFQSQCEVPSAPSQVDAYQAVLDFAPNQWTSKHTHSGPVCVSQLVGDITFRFDSGLKVVPAGKSYLEDSNLAHAAGNLAATSARMLVTSLTPRGQAQAGASGPAEPNPAPRTFNVKNEINDLPAQLTIVHLVLDFAPGASTPMQSHGGWALHTVIAGELALQEKSAQKTVKTGEGWSEAPGLSYALTNNGAGIASLYETVLLPKGATLTTDQATRPATIPTTGGAAQDWGALWLLIAMAIVALVCGRLLWRKSRRT